MADQMISLRLDVDLRERLTLLAEKRGWSRSELIRKVLTAWCDSQEGVR